MPCCPWCGNRALKTHTIRIGDTHDSQDVVVSPHQCCKCGAEEISRYAVADGRRPTPTETEKGFYKGENVRRRDQRQNSTAKRNLAARRSRKGESSGDDEDDEHQ